ncbi:heterokaryon incompatibility protein-domain-containing protein [Xylaria flabelliformis]|nr:heterokaryon incompatibility protein-domain-containing protein [Xylaria flabelliformis]
MASSPTIYQPLEPGVKSIRVLELLPSVFEADLRGILRTVALNDKPSYEALSYTWGTRTEGRTLKIRQNPKWMSRSNELPITDNLFQALRRLRYLLKPRVLWVDAVCINQEDIDERSAQVALMAEIYSNASSTAIWLGDVGDKTIHDSDLTPAQRSLHFASSILPLDILWNSDCLLMDHALQTTSPSWKDRGWIIQEYALSRRPYFQFGSRTRMIDKASPYGGQQGGAIPDSGLILEKKIYFRSLGRLTERLKKFDLIKSEIERGKQMSLYHAALATGASTTTDPRDKVYSLLSFLNPIEKDLVYPDYRISTELVFSRATYAAFKGPTKFAMLELIIFDTFRASINLPTWVYDFRTFDPYSRHDIDDASTEVTIPSLEMNAEGTELSFEGVCADVVVGTTPSLPGFWEECSDHSDHDINTDDCIVAELSRKVVELVELTESSIRRGTATNATDHSAGLGSIEMDENRRQFIADQIFAKRNGRVLQENIIHSLFANWETITGFLGISRAYKTPSSQSSEKNNESKPKWSSMAMHDQTRYYCKEASGSAVVFSTMNGNLGVAPGTIKGGDKLILPLCETALGEVDARVIPFNQPLALILREGEDNKWTFHGLAHLDGLGNK